MKRRSQDASSFTRLALLPNPKRRLSPRYIYHTIHTQKNHAFHTHTHTHTHRQTHTRTQTLFDIQDDTGITSSSCSTQFSSPLLPLSQLYCSHALSKRKSARAQKKSLPLSSSCSSHAFMHGIRTRSRYVSPVFIFNLSGLLNTFYFNPSPLVSVSPILNISMSVTPALISTALANAVRIEPCRIPSTAPAAVPPITPFTWSFFSLKLSAAHSTEANASPTIPKPTAFLATTPSVPCKAPSAVRCPMVTRAVSDHVAATVPAVAPTHVPNTSALKLRDTHELSRILLATTYLPSRLIRVLLLLDKFFSLLLSLSLSICMCCLSARESVVLD